METASRLPTTLEVRIHDSLAEIDADSWNLLGGANEPFLSHEFLIALERHGAASELHGWYPRHLSVRSGDGMLLGAMPMYLKTNSWGEFVFDWSWASAYHQAGERYYPKLVVAVPYTPVTGPRLLVHPEADGDVTKRVMIEQATKIAADNELTGLHWLFSTEHDTQSLRDRKLIMRLGCQYHWHNNAYEDFDHFLDAFSSRKRKKVRRERRRVAEQDITSRIVHGDEADERLWRIAHGFYVHTFDKKANVPVLTLDFFLEVARTLDKRVVLVLAERDGEPVACAINFRSDDTLYGRYWGCSRDFHSLHFETCYYQGIDYCIAHGLKRFEPGAQGEHKIWRGFLPTKTWSAHWIAHPEFRRAISNYCQREQFMMERQYHELTTLSPFREGSTPPTHDL